MVFLPLLFLFEELAKEAMPIKKSFVAMRQPDVSVLLQSRIEQAPKRRSDNPC